MAVKYWTGVSGTTTGIWEFDYDTGTHSPVVNEVINVVGLSGSEFATVIAWTVASGAWGTSDAAGKMWVHLASINFQLNLENNDPLEDSGTTQICITTGGATSKFVDWQVAGNWGTGEGVTVPVADDEVIFDNAVDIKFPTSGMLDSESGSAAQCTFDLLHFKVGWTGDIGTAAEPLCCSPDKIVIDGSGTYYILCGKDNQSTDTTVTDVFINNADAIVYLYSNANDGANTCEFTNVYVMAGTLNMSFYCHAGTCQ